MHCLYYDEGACRSCQWLRTPYAEQLQNKMAHCQSTLAGFGGIWLPIVPSVESAFRNKAKMVVSGQWAAPRFGILDESGDGVDLSNCPLYPSTITDAFGPVKQMIRQLKIPPYDVRNKCGELKYLLVTVAEHDGSLMVRFVMRSTDWLSRIRGYLPVLMMQLPDLAVLSINIQPVHQAIIEGDHEIILTERKTLTMQLNGIPFHLRPKSFFQTNTYVAEQLYATVRKWVAEVAPTNLWDQFCGVGGFALHCADSVSGSVTGIEISEEAIASARQSAYELGLKNVSFHALDADRFIAQAKGLRQMPDLVIVNPPRRGLGSELSRFLDQSTVQTVVYSSCNPKTLARDLAMMPCFELVRAQVFDLFPHTAHSEVLVQLKRKEAC